ncbi:MAG: energy-coupling factor transporter ATPase [Ruminococcaceae bacterium]|nr:energy-coupling factor transporter ATPase [Oscillospiraceae bacterium]
MSYIEMRNVCFSYEDDTCENKAVLDNVSLNIEKGEFVAVLGRNGSGKSTLAKLLNMILTPCSGEIIIDGVNICEDMSDEAMLAVRKKIGMVFQNPDNQIFATIVEEDVAFGPENLGVESSEIRRRVDEALATVDMTEYARHAPHKLSGGQKQRVAIAGVLAMDGECIVFDESTSMLDPRGRAEICEVMRKLNKEKGKTVIHITHNMNEAEMADRIIVIDDVGIRLDGSPKEVFSDVQTLKELGLEAPQATELCDMLARSGFDIGRGIIGEENCASAIERAVKLRRA